MPQIENHLSISVLAAARPQLALELFKAIRERGCEVEDCRFAPVGDRLSASLVVSGNWSALGRLETHRVLVRRTDRDGTISVTTDGTRMRVRSSGQAVELDVR